MHWHDVDEIAISLEKNYSDEDISELTLKYLEDLIKSLSDFDDHEIETNKVLKEILEAWKEIKDSNFED
ncbi:MAG: Fe-S cluster assembly protein IscX [Candidatus Tisiphia sp.]